MASRAGSTATLTAQGRQQISEVRSELEVLHRIGEEEKDLVRAYGQQITALKRDLALVLKQIEFEGKRKEELAQTLQEEGNMTVANEHVDALRRRDFDIRQICEEKAAMLEWLQRGVNEAQRITIEVERLKTSDEAAHNSQTELTADNRRLQQMMQRMELELEETKAKTKRYDEEKIALEEHIQHQSGLLKVTDDIVQSTRADCNRLTADAQSMQNRARDVETIEVATGCLAAAVRRSLFAMEKLQQSISKGVFPSDAEEEEYDSDHEADETRVTSVILSSTKAKIGRCDALLMTVWSMLKRFDGDEKQRNELATKNHNELIERMRGENAAVDAQQKADIERLKAINAQREPQLRRFLAVRDQAVANASYGELLTPEGKREPFNLLRHIEEENNSLIAEVQKLRSTSDALQKLTGSMEDDYRAVKQLKHEYRELEGQKSVLSHSIREAEELNNELRFVFRENPTKTKAPPTKKAWRVTASND